MGEASRAEVAVAPAAGRRFDWFCYFIFLGLLLAAFHRYLCELVRLGLSSDNNSHVLLLPAVRPALAAMKARGYLLSERLTRSLLDEAGEPED